jgi:hypothetical protein
MNAARERALFQAVLNRIGEQGDMHIRIRSETFRRVLLGNGYSWNFDCEPYREIDAVALEALVMRTGHGPLSRLHRTSGEGGE